MPLTIRDVCDTLDARFPLWLAEQWDRVGLVAGDPLHEATRVYFAVDPVASVIDDAIAWKADLLVVHHPLLLHPVSTVAADSYKGALIHKLIRSGCALYTAHTNADAAAGGVADELCAALDIDVERPLVPSGRDPEQGIGRIGSLAQAVSLQELADKVSHALPPTAHGVRIAGNLDAPVQRIAVLPGAGDSEFDAVRAASADVFITADLRHHPASEAREQAIFTGGKPYLLDVSHSASESLWLGPTARWLEQQASHRGHTLDTRVDARAADPWTARIP